MDYNFIKRVGELHENRKGNSAEIIEYFSAHNCTIQFEDGTIIKNIQYGTLIRGLIGTPKKTQTYKKQLEDECFGINHSYEI